LFKCAKQYHISSTKPALVSKPLQPFPKVGNGCVKPLQFVGVLFWSGVFQSLGTVKLHSSRHAMSSQTGRFSGC
jgi:hypothetical protein